MTSSAGRESSSLSANLPFSGFRASLPFVYKHRASMHEPAIFEEPQRNDDEDPVDEKRIFIFGSATNSKRMLALGDELNVAGVDVSVVGETRFNSACSYSHDHGEITRNIRSAGGVIICLDHSLLESVAAFEFGDALVTAFTVTKTLQAKNVIIAALDVDSVLPPKWGWNPIYARFSALPVVDLSAEVGSEDWKISIASIVGWCNDRRTAFDRKLDITRHPVVADKCVFHRTMTTLASGISFRSPWLRKQSKNMGRAYDIFLTHNWGPDSLGRDNHARAIRVATYLRSHGLQVFLDDWEMHRYRNIDEAMVHGTRYASVVVIMLTQTYIQKVETGNIWDNCVAEFNLSKLARGTILAIMEPGLRTPSAWGYNSIFGQLSSRLYVDLSADDGHSISMLGCGRSADSVQRWFCGLDALEMRIRSECAMIEGIGVRQDPVPFVPMRGGQTFTSFMFLLASLLGALAAVFRVSFGPGLERLRLIQLSSWLAWTIGFCVQACFVFLLCRKPPHFDIHWLEIQWAQIISILLKVLASLVGLTTSAATMASQHLRPHEKKLTFSALSLLLLGNSFQVMSVWFFAKNTDEGLDMHAWFTYRNLPHFGAVALSISVFLSISSMVLDNDLDTFDGKAAFTNALDISGASGLVLSSLLFVYWSVRSTHALAEYYQSAPRRHPSDMKAVSLGSDRFEALTDSTYNIRQSDVSLHQEIPEETTGKISARICNMRSSESYMKQEV